MTRTRNRIPLVVPVVALLAWGAVAAADQPEGVSAPAAITAKPSDAQLRSLDWAFRFAAAIHNDDNDRGLTQETVVREYLDAGALDEALAKAADIEGWRRGVAYAETARSMALAGRAEEARKLVEKAEEVRQGVTGWENPRISSHIARALAALGDVERSEEISASLAANDRQYSGTPSANAAIGMASRGDFDMAMARLAEIDAKKDIELVWWRTEAYIDLGRRQDLTREQRLAALDAAADSTKDFGGWKRAEMLEDIAAAYDRLDTPGKATGVLEEAEATLLEQPDDVPGKAPTLAKLARAWARSGQPDKARKILAEAEKIVPLNMVTEQPVSYAFIASAWNSFDAEEGKRMWGTALGAAESLQNPRPRNMSVSTICRMMARAGVSPSDDMTRRLEALLAVSTEVLPPGGLPPAEPAAS